jgi:hypothetical protein
MSSRDLNLEYRGCYGEKLHGLSSERSITLYRTSDRTGSNISLCVDVSKILN